MATPRTFFLLLALMLSATATAESKAGKTAPLFASNDVLDVTIRAPFTTIMKERSLDEEQPGTLTYNDPKAGEVTVEIGVRTRGRFRRQSDTCKWAPLRLNFKKSTVKKTVFAGSDKMKLVTHCRPGATRYFQALQSEFLAYRILNLLTDKSFRVRMMRVTYVDTDKKDRENTEFAFVIEHKSQLARRIGLEVNETPSTRVNYLDARHTNLTSLYQYLIGNTDFSPIKAAPGLPCCHNYVLFGDERGKILPIPYDFDMTGIVDAPHSEPGRNFKLRNVRQRLYRGRCANNSHVAETVQAFIDRKQAIYELINSHELYNARTRKNTLQFLDEFYATIEKPARVKSYLVDKCLG